MVVWLSLILLNIQQTLQVLVQNQRTSVAVMTPTTAAVPQSAKPIREELAQGITPNTYTSQSPNDL